MSEYLLWLSYASKPTPLPAAGFQGSLRAPAPSSNPPPSSRPSQRWLTSLTGFASRDPDLRHLSTRKLLFPCRHSSVQTSRTVSPTVLGPTSIKSVSASASSRSGCLNSRYRGSASALAGCSLFPSASSNSLLSPCLAFSDRHGPGWLLAVRPEDVFGPFVCNSDSPVTSPTLAGRDQLIRSRPGFRVFFLP